MKKKLLTSILLSTVILSQGAALVSVKAEQLMKRLLHKTARLIV